MKKNVSLSYVNKVYRPKRLYDDATLYQAKYHISNLIMQYEN